MSARDAADFGATLRRAAGAIARAEDWDWFCEGLSPPARRLLLAEFFDWQAHGGQEEPGGQWRTWLMRAGRGFGKTLAGAHWVAARAREVPGARIALVGGSYDEVAKVMIEGESGLLAVAREEGEMLWMPTRGTLRFASGAEAFVHSARAAEKLRGPQHHFAWCDELAKWPASGSAPQGEAAWDNLMMGLRLGAWPRAVVTTTPRASALLRRVRGAPGTVETQGRTDENLHLAAAVRDWLDAAYGGTRLGRQELEGMVFDEAEGALFTRAMLEAARVEMPVAPPPAPEPEPGPWLKRTGPAPPRPAPVAFARVVVGVDPPASAEGVCGIVVCGRGEDGRCYVLADASAGGLRPEGWARRVARAAAAWDADRVVAEKNQGGDMVGSVLAGVDAALPVKLVSASRGKAARAEPVAARFENGRAFLAGRFPELEDELCGLSTGGAYSGPGRSPDRADAMVWAMTALAEGAGEPSIRRL